MTGKISSILCTALLLTGLSVSVSQPAVRCDPWKLAEKFREELPRLGNQSWSKKQVGDYFWKHATSVMRQRRSKVTRVQGSRPWRERSIFSEAGF